MDLPDAILDLIAAHLPLRELCRARRVSRQFERVCSAEKRQFTALSLLSAEAAEELESEISKAARLPCQGPRATLAESASGDVSLGDIDGEPRQRDSLVTVEPLPWWLRDDKALKENAESGWMLWAAGEEGNEEDGKGGELQQSFVHDSSGKEMLRAAADVAFPPYNSSADYRQEAFLSEWSLVSCTWRPLQARMEEQEESARLSFCFGIDATLGWPVALEMLERFCTDVLPRLVSLMPSVASDEHYDSAGQSLAKFLLQWVRPGLSPVRAGSLAWFGFVSRVSRVATVLGHTAPELGEEVLRGLLAETKYISGTTVVLPPVQRLSLLLRTSTDDGDAENCASGAVATVRGQAPVSFDDSDEQRALTKSSGDADGKRSGLKSAFLARLPRRLSTAGRASKRSQQLVAALDSPEEEDDFTATFGTISHAGAWRALLLTPAAQLALQIHVRDAAFFAELDRRDAGLQGRGGNARRVSSVERMVRHFNALSLIATGLVVQCRTEEAGGVVLKFLADTIKALHILGSANAAIALLSGLNQSGVHRLCGARVVLEKDDDLERVQGVYSPGRGYYELRKFHREEATVPYLGMVLTDATFVREGNSDTAAGIGLNWKKASMLMLVIEGGITRFSERASPAWDEIDVDLQCALQSLEEKLDDSSGGCSGPYEEVAWQRSLVLRPRKS